MIFPFFYETKADHTMSLWNVCAMLAARFFLRLCSILCFLDFPALWLGRFVNLEGYKLSRLDRLHMGGGGVCVYTRNNLKAKVLKDLSSISERNFHQLWISLQWKKTKSIVVCTTYRPDDCPLSAFEDTLKPTYM